MELVRLAQSSIRQRRRGRNRGEVTRPAVVDMHGSDVAATAAAASAAVPHGLSSVAAEVARSRQRLLNLEAAIRVAEQIQEAEQQRRHWQQQQQQQQQQQIGDAKGWTRAPSAQQIGQEQHDHGQPVRVNSAGGPSRANAIQQEDSGSEEMTDALLNLLEELSIKF